MKLVVCVPVCPDADLDTVRLRANSFVNLATRSLPFAADELVVKLLENDDNLPDLEECRALDFFHPADHIILAKYRHALEGLEDNDIVLFMDDDVSLAVVGCFHIKRPVWANVLTFPVARLDGIFPFCRNNMNDQVTYHNCPEPGESVFSVCRPLWACRVAIAKSILDLESIGNANKIFELPYMISESCRKHGVSIIFSLDIIGTETPWQTNP